MLSSVDNKHISQILNILAYTYPNARCALVYSTPFQLLVATMLSAQCTDERVNKVTNYLFTKASTPAAFAALSPAQLEQDIRELGLFRIKAKNIIAAAKVIMNKYAGEVPTNRQELQSLPGVGRKTANVVLSNAFNIPALAVDTHVFRVARRLGLATANTPEKVEKELLQSIPEPYWSRAHHWLIHHGRQVCHARKPACNNCPLADLCHATNLRKNKNIPS